MTCGIQAEEHSHQAGEADSQQHAREIDENGPASDVSESDGGSDPDENADRAAEQSERDRFDQELHENVVTPGTDGQAQPDLPRSLGDGNHHDVHDPDAADDEG